MNKNKMGQQLNSCFSELEQALALITQQLHCYPLLCAKVFLLPEIEKGTEHEEINHINVIPLGGTEALDHGLTHFQRLFIHHHAQHISSKTAVRLPGVLCFSMTSNQAQAIQNAIQETNQLKKRLEQIITVDSGLPPEQRFDFVHQHLKGLLTLSAYRTITVLRNPTTVRFGWANKNIIKNLTRTQVVEQLEKSLRAKRAIPPYSREQWATLLEREMNDILGLPEDVRLKIKRPVKVQPIARVWYQEIQKQVQHPCAMPLITLIDETAQVPVPQLGDLPDYDAMNINLKHRPRAQKLAMVIPRLHLYRQIE